MFATLCFSSKFCQAKLILKIEAIRGLNVDTSLIYHPLKDFKLECLLIKRVKNELVIKRVRRFHVLNQLLTARNRSLPQVAWIDQSGNVSNVSLQS